MRRSRAVFIAGGSGYVGTRLALLLRDRYKVFATFYKNQVTIPGVTYLPLDLLDRDKVKRLVYTINPEIIIYAAGSNRLDWCEENSKEAENIHVGGAAGLLNVADILQPQFIFLSNGYVFDGEKGNYHEDDIMLPSSVLGRIKVNAENYVRGRSLNYVVIRSSPVYGFGNAKNLSFLDYLRVSLDHGQPLELPDNEYHSFAPIDGLLNLVQKAIETKLRNKTLHYGGLTKMSWCDFATTFAHRFNFDASKIQNKTGHRIGESDQTEYDFSLNFTNAIKTLKVNPLFLEQGFDLFEKDLVAGL